MALDQRVTRQKYIALLRGINVGGHNKIPMPDLRALCTKMGWGDVRSYIQSGNIVFSAKATTSSLEDELEQAIEQNFGFEIIVIVRTAEDWFRYMTSNPFPEAAAEVPKLLMLGLSKNPPNSNALEALQQRAATDEHLAQTGNALWIHFGGGVANSKLSPAVLNRLVGSPVTARNWRTVLKLNELLEGP